MKRTEIIAEIAAALFGRAADGGPEKGWMAKLSRAMGVTPAAVRQTLAKDSSPVFDRKLCDLIEKRQRRLRQDAIGLLEYRDALLPEMAEPGGEIVAYAHAAFHFDLPESAWFEVELHEDMIIASIRSPHLPEPAFCVDGGYILCGEKLTLFELIEWLRPVTDDVDWVDAPKEEEKDK
jgi:hypothetical protein